MRPPRSCLQRCRCRSGARRTSVTPMPAEVRRVRPYPVHSRLRAPFREERSRNAKSVAPLGEEPHPRRTHMHRCPPRCYRLLRACSFENRVSARQEQIDLVGRAVAVLSTIPRRGFHAFNFSSTHDRIPTCRFGFRDFMYSSSDRRHPTSASCSIDRIRAGLKDRTLVVAIAARDNCKARSLGTAIPRQP